MPAAVGRATTIEKNSVALIGIKSLSIEYSGGSIDVTSGENGGIQTLLDVSSVEALSFSVEGVAKDEVIRDLVLGGTQRLFTDMVVNYDNGDTLSVDMFLTSFNEGYPDQEGKTFSASFSSSGAWTYTQA